MKTRYTVVDGEVIAEKRSGVRKQYVPDPLGSTVALLDNTQAQTDTFTYWPYGEEASRTGTTPASFRFVGTVGYYRDSSTRTYVRARYLDTQKGRWTTEDPIGFSGGDWNLYRYVSSKSCSLIDPFGFSSVSCKQCGQQSDIPQPSFGIPWLPCIVDAISAYCPGKCPNITPRSILCQIFAESGGNPNDQSPGGKKNGGMQRGLLQISEKLWNDNCNEFGSYKKKWSDPCSNIKCAIKIMCQVQKIAPCSQCGPDGWGTDCTPGERFDCCKRCHCIGIIP